VFNCIVLGVVISFVCGLQYVCRGDCDDCRFVSLFLCCCCLGAEFFDENNAARRFVRAEGNVISFYQCMNESIGFAWLLILLESRKATFQRNKNDRNESQAYPRRKVFVGYDDAGSASRSSQDVFQVWYGFVIGIVVCDPSLSFFSE